MTVDCFLTFWIRSAKMALKVVGSTINVRGFLTMLCLRLSCRSFSLERTSDYFHALARLFYFCLLTFFIAAYQSSLVVFMFSSLSLPPIYTFVLHLWMVVIFGCVIIQKVFWLWCPQNTAQRQFHGQNQVIFTHLLAVLCWHNNWKLFCTCRTLLSHQRILSPSVGVLSASGVPHLQT